MQKFLLIQTAFLGDVILATPLIRELKLTYPNSVVDVLVRKGNENLLNNNPHIGKVYIWDKKQGKYKNLLKQLRKIRAEKYTEVIGIQRYFNSGLLTALSGAPSRIGFSNNPLSFLFTKKIDHTFGDGTHEVERNLKLIAHHIIQPTSLRPEMYPSAEDYNKVKEYQSELYYCIAPTSVWFTKQMSADKWVELIQSLDKHAKIYLLGAPNDKQACEEIRLMAKQENVINLAGGLTLPQSAALIKNARRTYVNDSGPLHISSAMNAPVTAFFCSTIPAFGFGPLSEDAEIIEITEELYCRPCGMHGHKACPEGHFKCNANLNVKRAKK